MELNNTDVHIVKEDGSVVTTSKAPPSVQNRVSIHHYMVKSRQVCNMSGSPSRLTT